tara:strand:- start:1738 stop:2634 length:897 start_codon:yes stop_codon:yes gene_type:complete
MIDSKQVDTESHTPVLLKEAMFYLNIQKNGIYLDGTVGLGGHSLSILKDLSKNGRLIGFDRDSDALKICNRKLSQQKNDFTLTHNSYHKITEVLKELGVGLVDGILLDLGLSSFQLDSAERGFNSTINSNLDMRFDKSQKRTAKDFLNHLGVVELANLIYKYGDERRSRIIAKNIEKIRPINKVHELLEAIRRSTPPKNRQKTVSRVFQALRIAVNDELGKLENFLTSFHSNLKIGGKIVIISFHSLEDRLVKHAFKSLEKSKVIKVLTKKPITPSETEIDANRRSRSSKMRVAERVL